MYPKQHPEIGFRTFDDIILLINAPKALLHELNEIASHVWKLCDGSRSLVDIADVISSEYDTTQEQALKDITELTQSMSESGVLILEKKAT